MNSQLKILIFQFLPFTCKQAKVVELLAAGKILFWTTEWILYLSRCLWQCCQAQVPGIWTLWNKGYMAGLILQLFFWKRPVKPMLFTASYAIIAITVKKLIFAVIYCHNFMVKDNVVTTYFPEIHSSYIVLVYLSSYIVSVYLGNMFVGIYSGSMPWLVNMANINCSWIFVDWQYLQVWTRISFTIVN